MLVIVVRSLPVRAAISSWLRFISRTQAVQGLRGFDGIQILALDVFDQCDFEDPVVRIVLNDRWDFGQSGQFGSSKAPLACDQFVMIRFLPHQQWLYYTMCFYRVS